MTIPYGLTVNAADTTLIVPHALMLLLSFWTFSGAMFGAMIVLDAGKAMVSAIVRRLRR